MLFQSRSLDLQSIVLIAFNFNETGRMTLHRSTTRFLDWAKSSQFTVSIDILRQMAMIRIFTPSWKLNALISDLKKMARLL